MFTKIIIVAIMMAIIGALASSLIFLVRGNDTKNNLIKGLTWRIFLSIGLFLFLCLAFKLNWITPHAI